MLSDIENINAELAAVAVSPEGYPETGLPEIAVIGKSNVGKSSFINALLNKKSLARVSGTPGKTRTINFYTAADSFCLVDLPGYGYAKLSKSESAKWGKMIEGYLKNRKELKFALMLLDIRHEPGTNDSMMFEWFKHYGREVVFVATKADKIKRSALQKNISIIKKKLDLDSEYPVLAFSSLTWQGREELLKLICGRIVYNNEINE